MPDRFADGDEQNNTCKELKFNPNINRNDPNARHGGDIAGIKAKIPYLKELGVTAIWLTPVLENDMPGGSYHGYATTDYYRVDPRFGSNEEYKELIAECHKAGIKVVMDMIFNHCGIAHPWLADTPSKDWLNSPVDVKQLGEGMLGKQPMPKEFNNTNFKLTPNHDPYTSNYDYDKTVNGWFVPAMPDLNQRNPHLMTYLIQNSIWWIEYAKINGIRMDTYPYADMAGMAKWNVAVDKEYPNFNIVGESWFEDVASIAFMQKDNKINPKGKGIVHDVVSYTYNGNKVTADCRHARKGRPVWNGSFEADGPAYDMLSIFYYIRQLDYSKMKPGDKRSVVVFSGHRKEILTVKYVGVEEIELRDDKTIYNTHHIKFSFTQEDKKKSSDDMDTWISVSATKIPLMLKGKLPIGEVRSLPYYARPFC
nr:unnamed protein product [uncultured bacterium]